MVSLEQWRAAIGFFRIASAVIVASIGIAGYSSDVLNLVKFFKVVAHKDFGHQQKLDFDFTRIAQHVYLMLNPDFQPCPLFQSAVTEEFIK